LDERKTREIIVGRETFGIGAADVVDLCADGGDPRGVGARGGDEAVVLVAGCVGSRF
jgi:hypothetical protein